MAKILCLALAAALLWLTPHRSPASGGAIYYVSQQGDDANPGTADRPWRHIEWGITRPFLRPGDTIRIRSGVYRPVAEPNPSRNSVTDDTLIRPVASGEPGRPITVMAEPGHSFVLSGRRIAAPWEPAPGFPGVYFHVFSLPVVFPYDHPFQVVEDGRLLYRVSTLEAMDRPGRCFVEEASSRIYVRTTDDRPPAAHLMEYGVSVSGIEFRNGVEHWRLEGFAITGFRSSGVLIALRAGRIELDQMDISYIGAHRPGADLSNGYAVVTFDTVGGNHVHQSSLHHNLAEAVHVSQSGGGDDVYEHNEIHSNGGSAWFQETHNGRVFTGPGMILRGDRVTVRGNRFYGNGYHGLILESDLQGSEGPAAPGRNVIEGNVFALNAGNGIHADGKNGLTASGSNIIRFNLLEHNNQARASGGDGELRLAGNFDDTLVYNNTLYTDKANCVLLYASRVADRTAQGADASPDRLRLLNNIAVYTGRIPGVYALRAIDLPADAMIDYNNWRRSGAAPLIAMDGVEFASLEEFRARTGRERRGLSLDPRFVSPLDSHFWLRAVSPMIGRGVADVRGDATLWAGPSPGTPVDLGAFPYRALLAVAAAELRFAALVGRDPAAQTLEIRSSAGAPLAWNARIDNAAWLRLSSSAGQTPAALTVSARASTLPPAQYAGTVQITPALEGEAPIPVTVSLTVLPSPPRRR